MACTKQWLNVAGAGLCGVGSGIGIFAGSGTPATGASACFLIAAVAWFIASAPLLGVIAAAIGLVLGFTGYRDWRSQGRRDGTSSRRG